MTILIISIITEPSFGARAAVHVKPKSERSQHLYISVLHYTHKHMAKPHIEHVVQGMMQIHTPSNMFTIVSGFGFTMKSVSVQLPI